MSTKVSTLLLELLTEARRKDLPYTEKKVKEAIDKVIVEVSGKESAKFTVLAKKYKDLKEATEALAKSTAEVNAQIKEEAIDLFDASDEVYSRIVETASMTIKIGRRQPDSVEKVVTVEYEKIIKEISDLVPDLTEQIQKIIEANTTITNKTVVAKAPQLRVDLKDDKVNEGVLDNFATIVKVVRSVGKALLNSIKAWGRGYDRRLSDIRDRYDHIDDLGQQQQAV